jgi:nucleotide-binding universal stress UspA family protein
MADVVLIVLRRPELARSLLEAGERMGKLMAGARLNVLAVRDSFQVSSLAAEALIEETDSVLRARQQEQERVAALHRIFAAWLRDRKAEADWAEVEGNAPTIIAERGSRADLVVAGQPLMDDRPARRVFSAALFGTDRPVLMVPEGSRAAFGGRVAIAWRDERRAVKALIPALRWLAAAEEVHVLTGVREGDAAPGMPRVLFEHEIAAKLHVLRIGRATFGETLLETVHRLSADLLVMGAYVHSPLRELILGGVTRYMLDHADVPVLMRH